MNDYDKQTWFDLYGMALMELKRAAMTGRIGDARTEIAGRLEMLKRHPDLHKQEHQAMRDALSSLRALEREEERLAAEDKKRILQETVQTIQTLSSKFKDSGQQTLETD
jgi:hypothetical protein